MLPASIRLTRHLIWALASGLTMHIVCGLLTALWTALAIGAGRVDSFDESWHGDLSDRWTGATWLVAALCYAIVLLISRLVTYRIFRWQIDYIGPALATVAYLGFAILGTLPMGSEIGQVLAALPWIMVVGLDGSAVAGYLIPLAFSAWLLNVRRQNDTNQQHV